MNVTMKKFRCRDVSPGYVDDSDEEVIAVDARRAASNYATELLSDGAIDVDEEVVIEVIDEAGGEFTFACVPEVHVSVRRVVKAP